MDQFDSEDEGRGRPGVPVDAGRLLQALRRHWRVIPTAVAAGALIGLAVAMLLIKPTYTAKATLLWEPPSDAEPSDRSFLTQVDSIKLTSLVSKITQLNPIAKVLSFDRCVVFLFHLAHPTPLATKSAVPPYRPLPHTVAQLRLSQKLTCRPPFSKPRRRTLDRDSEQPPTEPADRRQPRAGTRSSRGRCWSTHW